MNWIGILLGMVGISLMLFLDNGLYWGLGVTFIGAFLYGGIPTSSELRVLAKASPIMIIASIGIVIFFIKEFGEAAFMEQLIGTALALLFIQTFFVRGLHKLFGV